MALKDMLKRAARLGRPRHVPVRETLPFPNLVQMGGVSGPMRMAIKPTPRNLRNFSRNVYARRAINAIKNPIALMDWEVKTKNGVDMTPELASQIEVASYCLDHPNADDSFRTWVEQVVEDVLHGAGASEIRSSGDPIRPLWLFPVDGLTIQINPAWAGNDDEVRYVQVPGYGSTIGSSGFSVTLRNDELMYIRPNSATYTPFGLGPMEVAFTSIARIIGVGEFAGNVASNARPSIGLDLGDGVDGDYIAAFRAYWRNEVEGQGQMPIFGLDTRANEKRRGAEVVRLYPEGDSGLFLKWQEFLKTEIALAFDESPMNLGVERDVNRNTAEVGQDRDRDNAIKPYAKLIASHITRDALHRTLGFHQLEFVWKGLDPEDEQAHAEVYEREFKNNAVTPNEYRARRGMPPMQGPWGDLCFADMQIAIEAARGAAQVTDPDLPGASKAPAKPAQKTAPKPKAASTPKANPAPNKG